MNRNKLQVINVAGTNYEIGLQIGRQTKDKILAVLNTTEYVNLPESKEVAKAYEQYFSHALACFPQYVDELRGMADGAGADFRRLLKLNVPELKTIAIKPKDKKQEINAEDSCTTLVLKQEKKVLIAHNEDGPANQDIFVINAMLPSGVFVLGLHYYGALMGFTANITSNGIFMACNALTCNDQRAGIPKRFITRHALEADTCAEFVKRITCPKRAQGQNYVIFFKGRVYNIEVSANDFCMAEINENFAHANNFLYDPMLKYEARSKTGTPKEKSTFLRSYVSSRLIISAETEKQMLDILSSHENAPFSICSHGNKNLGLSRTLGTVIFDSTKLNRLKISRGAPCKAQFAEHFLEV